MPTDIPEDPGVATDLNSHLAEVDFNDSLIGNCVEDFEVIKTLGKGGYGTCFLVRALNQKKFRVEEDLGKGVS